MEEQIIVDKQKGNKVKFTHNWLFVKLCESRSFRRDALRLALNDEKFRIIDADRSELVPTAMGLADGSLGHADAVMTVPLSDRGGSEREIIARFLFEHKSRIDRNSLGEQLVRYQGGLYQGDNTPVINVVVTNGSVPGFGGVFQFRHWLKQMDREFWREYDRYVMDFDALVVNLRDPQVQSRLLAPGLSTAVGWYAMGTVSGAMDRTVGTNMVEMIGRLEGRDIARIWWPTYDYLQRYHKEVTMGWLQDLEIQESGSDKVMALALSSLELREQKALQKGIDKSRTTIAERLLRRGFDSSTVGEITDLDQDQLERIKSTLDDPD